MHMVMDSQVLVVLNIVWDTLFLDCLYTREEDSKDDMNDTFRYRFDSQT